MEPTPTASFTYGAGSHQNFLPRPRSIPTCIVTGSGSQTSARFPRCTRTWKRCSRADRFKADEVSDPYHRTNRRGNNDAIQAPTRGSNNASQITPNTNGIENVAHNPVLCAKVEPPPINSGRP